jgi:hypothetical protein
MSADELHQVVEKSGLLSDKKLLATYRDFALYHRMVLPRVPLDITRGDIKISDRVSIRNGQMVWFATLSQKNGRYIVYICAENEDASVRLGEVSFAGISIRLYFDRQCYTASFTPSSKSSVYLGHFMCDIPQTPLKSVIVLVHVPDSALNLVTA